MNGVNNDWLPVEGGRSPSKLATKKGKTDKLTKLERQRKKEGKSKEGRNIHGA